MGSSMRKKGPSTREPHGPGASGFSQSKTRSTAQGSVESGYADGEKSRGRSKGGADQATYGGRRTAPGKGYGK